MTMLQSVIFAFTVLLLIGILILFLKNGKLKEELKNIKEILTLKDKTIENYENSRVAVKEILDNINLIDEVMPLLNKNESKRLIADRFNISLSQVEMIIKVDKLKKSKV